MTYPAEGAAVDTHLGRLLLDRAHDVEQLSGGALLAGVGKLQRLQHCQGRDVCVYLPRLKKMARERKVRL